MPVRRNARQQRLPVVGAQLFVQAPLRPFELALDGLLASLGQLGGDLLLGATKDEGSNRAGENREVVRLGRGASGRRRLERCRRPEQARVEELEQAPQLAEVVLDRRAAQRQTMLRP